MNYEEADSFLLRCDSFSRLPELISLHWRLPSSDWLRLLGEYWPLCDNIGRHRLTLRRLLPPTGPVLELMTEEEQEAYYALPELLTVFRGCGPKNMLGACWSLDRDVAARFPLLNRYRQEEPLLVTATVKREHVLAIKLERDEAEVITFNARRSSVESLA